MEESIDKVLGNSRTGAQPSTGVSWKSLSVRDEYDREKLEEAYIEAFGDNGNTENVLFGLLGSPLVSCELYTSGARKGTFLMDGSTIVKIKDLLEEKSP